MRITSPTTSNISVIIPFFDREPRLLHEAIDSVIHQSIQVREIIVVDDGSTNPIAPYLVKYENLVQVIRQNNSGIGSARDAGIKVSSGSLLAFLDSDDTWTADKTERQLQALGNEPDLQAVYGRASQFYDEKTDDAFQRRHPIKTPEANAWLSTAMLIKKSAFLNVGYFGSEAGVGVDIDWHLRASRSNLRSRMLDCVVYNRRLHVGNSSLVDHIKGNSMRIRALKKNIDRNRANTPSTSS